MAAQGDDQAQDYCLIWRDYKVDWNSVPDASHVENNHLNRQKHQALASRLTMIPRAYMLRFCYNDDHRIQRAAYARLIGKHMTEEQVIDRASRKVELSSDRHEHVRLIQRHTRQEMPLKEDIINNAFLNDGKSSNFLAYMTAMPTGGPDMTDARRLRLIDPEGDRVQPLIGARQAWEREVECARVATTDWDRKNKQNRLIVESPQYMNNEKVTVNRQRSILVRHGCDVLELQPPEPALHGCYSRAQRRNNVGWHHLPPKMGSRGKWSWLLGKHAC